MNNKISRFLFDTLVIAICAILIFLTLMFGQACFLATMKAPPRITTVKVFTQTKGSEGYIEKEEEREMFVVITRGETARTPEDLQEIAKTLCQEFKVPYKVVEAIVWTESRWLADVPVNHNENGTIDVGLFQLNNQSWADISERIGTTAWDPYKPVDNLWAGIKYLASWYRHWEKEGYKGNELDSMAISSYALPTDTLDGEMAWWYINRVRNRLGWE